MIVCPNCNHQNPDGAVQCEACYTPLPAMTTCPSCGSAVQTDASFCGQCGHNLKTVAAESESGNPLEPTPTTPTVSPDFDIPDLMAAEPLVEPEPLVATGIPSPAVRSEGESPAPEAASAAQNPPAAAAPPPNPDPAPAVQSPPTIASGGGNAGDYHTMLQVQTARLLHLQTNTPIELPASLPVIHLGKPNDRIPPDIDVSGFPNSEIVSRIHADIRVEGDIYYIEDVGSSNGTYINNLPLPMGNRHRLRPGDRIALGKGDKVTFLFQMA